MPTARMGLIGIKRHKLVAQYSFALDLEVLELPALHGPREDGQDDEHEPRRERDQQIQAFHGSRIASAPGERLAAR